METWQQFTVAIINGLAWPVAAVIMTLAARRPAIQLLERINEMAFGGVTAKFDRKLSETAEKVVATPLDHPALTADVDKTLLDLAKVSPRGAIMEGWVRLERKLRNLAGVANAFSPKYSGGGLIDEALQRGVIQPAAAQSLKGLYQLRTLAAHAPGDDLSFEKAQEFLVLSNAINYVLDQAAAKPSKV